MLLFKTGIGAVTKNRGEMRQWHFDFSESNAVADTQYDFPDTNPAIVAVQECTIAGAGILHADMAIFGQFNVGMEAGYRRVLNNKIT